MHFSLSTVLALGALHTFGVYAQDCINTCVENVKPTVGCADPGDASCVCVSNDFVKGVAECARAPECAAADDAITNGISNGFCVGQQVPAFPGAAATPVESAATSDAAAATTSESPAAPETTAVETTPAALPESSESSVTLEISATSESPETTPTDPAEAGESSATEEASASSTDASNSSATTEAADAAATSDSAENEDEDESAGGGMSGGAKAGVGIGVTIGILALLGITGFFWKKRQNQQNLPRGNMDDMSPPMAARDRSYPAPDQGSIGEKHGYDLELMSHRYEDMLPREEPRHMV
ncbi:hypothetical protein FLAG1_03743 [Fusarium langsethiae]|uniref:CFEM domain-containing protein n=1 Tax=Fusarium langsethiae TaxID=179993 RepID=A0A0N0DG16_FUSLA|nr:hypothetical protein FLAG1_03743 [Fusarium langsethiae]GKU01574.1 unnamed protein product [Fusarium langsethiae]GKU13461.1 unnamed protein product [Fusarium langsethiae]